MEDTKNFPPKEYFPGTQLTYLFVLFPRDPTNTQSSQTEDEYYVFPETVQLLTNRIHASFKEPVYPTTTAKLLNKPSFLQPAPAYLCLKRAAVSRKMLISRPHFVVAFLASTLLVSGIERKWNADTET